MPALTWWRAAAAAARCVARAAQPANGETSWAGEEEEWKEQQRTATDSIDVVAGHESRYSLADRETLEGMLGTRH